MLLKAQYTHSIFIQHLWSHGAAANHLAFHDETAVVTLALTKGTVLLVCLRCVDILVLVSKHAEGESTEKVQFFKDQNEKCLRFITFLSTNRLNKAMIDRKRRLKRLFLRY